MFLLRNQDFHNFPSFNSAGFGGEQEGQLQSSFIDNLTDLVVEASFSPFGGLSSSLHSNKASSAMLSADSQNSFRQDRSGDSAEPQAPIGSGGKRFREPRSGLPTSLRPRSVAVEVSIEPACPIHLQSAEPGAPPKETLSKSAKVSMLQKTRRAATATRKSLGAVRRGDQGGAPVAAEGVAGPSGPRDDEAADAEKAARPGTETGTPAEDRAVARAGKAEGCSAGAGLPPAKITATTTAEWRNEVTAPHSPPSLSLSRSLYVVQICTKNSNYVAIATCAG